MSYLQRIFNAEYFLWLQWIESLYRLGYEEIYFEQCAEESLLLILTKVITIWVNKICMKTKLSRLLLFMCNSTFPAIWTFTRRAKISCLRNSLFHIESLSIINILGGVSNHQHNILLMILGTFNHEALSQNYQMLHFVKMEIIVGLLRSAML